MREWWEQRDTREQVLLVVSVALLALFLLVSRVWEPLLAARGQLLEANRSTAMELTRARQLFANVELLRQERNAAPMPAGEDSPEKEVEKAVNNHALAINRLQPNQDGTLQLWLKDAPFSPVSSLLQELEEQRGFNLRDLSINAAKKTGNVDLRVKLQK